MAAEVAVGDTGAQIGNSGEDVTSENVPEEGEVSDSDQENDEDDGFGFSWKVPAVPAKLKKSSKSKSGASDKKKRKAKKDKGINDGEKGSKKSGRNKKKKEPKKSSWMTLDPKADSDSDSEKVDTSNSWYGVFRGSENDAKGRDRDKRSASRESGKSKKSKASSWYDLPEEVIGSYGLRGIGREASVRPESPPSPPRRSKHRNERRTPPRTRSRGIRSPPRPRTPPLPRSRTPPRPNDFYDIHKQSKHSIKERTRSPERNDLSDLDKMKPIGKSKPKSDGFWSKVPEEETKSRSRTRSPVPVKKAYGRDNRFYDENDHRTSERVYTRSPSPEYRSTSPPVRHRVYRYYETDEVRERDRRRVQKFSPPPPPTHRNRSRYQPPPRAPSPARTEVSVSSVGTSRSKGRSQRSCSRARRIYTEEEKIDKAKLLSIARENLSKMVDTGTLPNGIDVNRFKLRHLRELKDAKSIQEWTEFCRAISAMEAAAYSDSDMSGSDVSDDSDDDIRSVISEVTFKGRHPFVVAPKPEIIVKVRDFVTLKTRDANEVQKDLRESFPVSSGDRHRAIEWKQTTKEMGPPSALPPRMPPKKKIPKEQPDDSVTYLRAQMEAEGIPVNEEVMDCGPVGNPTIIGTITPDGVPMAGPAGENVFPETNLPKIDIGTVMSQRLSAMRVLQDDPTNAVALKQMADAQEMMDSWSKQCIKPGQWLGQTGAKILSTEQLQSGPQAWARPDALKNTVAIEGGIGKYLLKRLGWCEGKGLGKFENGPLEPVTPVLKFDTAGLRSEDETVKKLQVQLVSTPSAGNGGAQLTGTLEVPVAPDLPISRLSRYCLQKRYPPPEYEMSEESGPPHKPNFTMKVKVNNVWYQPTVSVRTKRGAKHLAASVCLQAFGLLPRDIS